MNLKKIGSALTAISMIASMATYVPTAVVSATGTDVVYTGELDYYQDVAYELNTTKDILVLKPAVADSKYEIPSTVLAEVAYEFVGATDGSATLAAGVASDAVTIKIEGKAVINVDESDNLTGASATTTVEADCRAVIKDGETITGVTDVTVKGLSETTADGGVTHDYQPNQTYHNHVCKNCNKVNNDYSAHKFAEADGATIDKTNHTHTCKCGKVDTEYLTVSETGVYSDADGNYRRIHGFVDNTNHYCAECGGYDKVTHQGSALTYAETATSHTITCKKVGDPDCGYAEKTEPHDYAPYYNENPAEKLTVGAHNDITTGSHYCVVCGYVNASYKHDYSYKFESYTDEHGAFKKKIVPATVASEKVVCNCGAVKPGHGDEAQTEADAHNYIGVNGMHICVCGDVTAEHNFCYNYNGKGAYTVNGRSGYIKVADNKGAACECGALNNITGDAHNCVTSISNPDKIYTDVNANKHYCTCGKVVVYDGDEVHDYTAKVQDGIHMCSCGAVSEEEHEYKNDRAYYYEVLWNTSTRKYERVKMTDTTVLTGYQKSSTDSTPVSFESSKAIVCRCGKVDSAHVCQLNKVAATTMFIDDVHYCTCGESSEEHVYDEDTNTCKVCGKYKDHPCEPTSINNCACKVCGKPVHSLIKYGTNSHMCSRCGTEVTAHVYSIGDKKHVCSICGYEATDGDNVHKFGKEGEQKCICQECGYVKHVRVDANNPATADVTEKHYCSTCGKDLSNEHIFAAETDRCACGEVKTGHRCAFDHVYNSESCADHTHTAGTWVNGDEVCKCGDKVAHEYKIENASEHKCTHKNGDTLCENLDNHTYDAATNTFCTTCGAVNFSLTALANVKSNYSNYKTNEISKYSTAYTVELSKAYLEVVAYDYATSRTNTLVAKTPDEQTEFNNKVKAFNDLLAAPVKSGCSATIKFVTGSKAFAEDPSKDAEKVNISGTDYEIVRGTYGQSVKIKVVPREGYKFVGWYDADSATAKLISTESEYTVELTEGNTDYFAKLEKNDTVRIEIGENIEYSGSITGDGTGAGAQVKFTMNETVTLKYKPATGENFLYFVDNNGTTYNGTLLTVGDDNGKYKLEFKVSGSVTKIDAKTTKLTGNNVFVVFKGGIDDKSKAEATVVAVKADDKVNLYDDAPVIPGRVGMNFIGWAIDGAWGKSESKTEPVATDRVKIKQVPVTGNTLTLVPVYENQKGFKLKIEKGSFVNVTEEQIAEGFTYKQKLGITAPEKDAETGKYFSGWYVNGVFYDATRTTYYTVKGNDTITAKYENDEPAEDISYLAISAATSYDTGVRVVNLSAKWKMLPADCAEVLDSGYVFSFTGKTQNDLKVENVDSSDVRIKVTGSTDLAATTNYPLTLKGTSTKNATVTAVAYLKIRDKNGVVKTIYSDNMVTENP